MFRLIAGKLKNISIFINLLNLSAWVRFTLLTDS